MAAKEIIRIKFAISADAWLEIDNIKAEYDDKFPDKADVVMISWGTTMFNNERSIDSVVIGYYSTFERRFIEHGIQKINDREVIFFVTAENVNQFEGKIICFERSRGFYLM